MYKYSIIMVPERVFQVAGMVGAKGITTFARTDPELASMKNSHVDAPPIPLWL
jgi:hypothetical protein